MFAARELWFHKYTFIILPEEIQARNSSSEMSYTEENQLCSPELLYLVYEDLYIHMVNDEEPGKKNHSFHVYLYAKILLCGFLLGVNISACVGFKV